jgi:hypothetical protein
MTTVDVSGFNLYLRLYNERVATYQRLEQAFKTLLLDEQEMIFSLEVQACTLEFKRINDEIVAARKESGNDKVKDLVKEWHDCEQQKLVATVRLQSLMKKHYIDRVRRDREEERMVEADRSGTNILHSHSHEEVPTTLAEKRQPSHDAAYNAEASKFSQKIARLIETINDCFAELKEVMEG